MKKELKKKDWIGHWVHFHEKDNKKAKYRGLCVDEVIEISDDYAHRLQKIIWFQEYNYKKRRNVNRQDKDLYITIRACYWVISKKNNSIVFGRFSMNSHPEIVGKLFKRANKKGFFKKKNYKQIKKELLKFKKLNNIE